MSIPVRLIQPYKVHQALNLSPIEEPNDFAGVPPVPGTLRVMAENEAPYTIREGVTLFDICDQLR